MNPSNILSVLIPHMLSISRLFSLGFSNGGHMSRLIMSSCSEAPENKHPNMTQEFSFFLLFFILFFTPTAADCSLPALLGSVERIFPSDLQPPPLVRSSPALCLKPKLSLSHVHTHKHHDTPPSLFLCCQSLLQLSLFSSSSPPRCLPAADSPPRRRFQPSFVPFVANP